MFAVAALDNSGPNLDLNEGATAVFDGLASLGYFLQAQ
jgi:hypothetical protein